MLKKNKTKIALAVLGGGVLALTPVLAVSCASVAKVSAQTASDPGDSDNTAVAYGMPLVYGRMIEGYEPPALTDTNYSPQTAAGTNGVYAEYTYRAASAEITPTTRKMRVAVSVAKRKVRHAAQRASARMARGSASVPHETAPKLPAYYGSWGAPHYAKTDGTPLTSAQLTNMAEGTKFTATYEAPLADPTNYEGEAAQFVVSYTVAATEGTRSADGYAVEYGTELAYALTVSGYDGPVLQTTNYTTATPVGTSNVTASYLYTAKAEGTLPASFTVIVNIAVNKRSLPPVDESASLNLTAGQVPDAYDGLPVLPDGYAAWGQPTLAQNGAPLTAAAIRVLAEGQTFTAMYRAEVSDPSNYTGAPALFTVTYTVHRPATEDRRQAYTVRYGEELAFTAPLSGYAAPSYTGGNYTRATNAGTSGVYATYEYDALDQALLPAKIRLRLDITVARKPLTAVDLSADATTQQGRDLTEYANLPALPSGYNSWQTAVLKDGAGRTIHRTDVAQMAVGASFTATYAADVTDTNNYTGSAARFVVRYTVTSKEADNPTANTDAPTPRTAGQPVDPKDWEVQADPQKLQEISTLLAEARSLKSDAPVTRTPNGSKTPLIMPTELAFTGTKGAAALVPIRLDAGIASDYSFRLYKVGTATQLQVLGDPTAALGTLSLSDGDKVVVLVRDKNQQLVQGVAYTVSGLGDGRVTHTVFTDPLTAKLRDRSASIEDVFAFMDQLKPGETYTSALAKTGNVINAIKIPDAEQMRATLDVPAVRRNKNGLYAPFVDSSLAIGSGGRAYGALYGYEALNLGFVQAQVSDANGLKAGELSWGGTVPIGDLNSAFGLQQLQLLYDLRTHNVDAAVSFGGATGTAISNFHDPILLAKVLEEFVKGTNSTRLDYDIEGADAADAKGMETLAEATALVQQKMLSEGKHLEVGLTLASEFSGLASGLSALNSFVANGVVLRYVNGMTMMMNPTVTYGKSVTQQQELAIDALKDQVKTAYASNGLNLTEAQAYRLIGATPNLGTDVWANEVMRPQDAQPLYEMLVRKKLGFFSFWNVQAFLTSVNGLASYMAGHAVAANFPDGTSSSSYSWRASDRNAFATAMSQLNTESDWAAFDPSYYGVGAYTNAATRQRLLSNVLNAYNGLSTGGTTSGTSVLSMADAEGRNLVKDTVFEWTSPADGLLHIWRTNWWVSAQLRPGSSLSTANAAFTDLGVSNRAYEQKVAAARRIYAAMSGGYFALAGQGAPGIEAALLSDGGTPIVPFDPNNRVGRAAGKYVIYNNALYVTQWYAEPESDPTGAAWLPVSITG